MTTGASVALGSFAVLADEAARDAFCRATGSSPPDGQLPVTFPMRWLASGQAREAIVGLLPGAGVVPFHEAQSFTYAAPLRVGAPYAMTLTGRLDREPDRLVVEGSVMGPDGAADATFAMTLRLFALGDGAAGGGS